MPTLRRMWGRLKTFAAWVWFGLGWPVVIGGAVLGACGWLVTSGRPTPVQVTSIVWPTVIYFFGFYSGRACEQLWMRRRATDRPVDQAERMAMFQVWRDAQFVADELADKSRLMLSYLDGADFPSPIARRFATSQLRATVELHDKARVYREQQMTGLTALQRAADEIRRARGDA